MFEIFTLANSKPARKQNEATQKRLTLAYAFLRLEHLISSICYTRIRSSLIQIILVNLWVKLTHYTSQPAQKFKN
jgi:hypothetical protein